MRTYVISYNENPANEYLILPKDDTPGAMVKGIEGCVNFLISTVGQISLEFDTIPGQDKINEEQKIALKKVADIHNKIYGVERCLRD